MIKRILSVLFLLLTTSLFSQYTDVINSNRPGFSESPYSVGIGIYQLESSLFNRKFEAQDPLFSNPQATGLDLHYRMGLLDEKLEFNLSTSLQSSTFAFTNVFQSSYSEFGFGQFTIGAKYLAYVPKYADKGKEIRSWRKRHGFDWKRWIPHVAGYAGINFGSFLNDYQERGGITPKVGVLLQNEFSNQFNLITNIYYNYIGSELPELSYIVTGTYNFNQRWSGFAEHQALFNKNESQSNIGFGAAYLFSRDLQINSSLRATFQESTVGYYASVGVSYRLNRHVDQYDELDEVGNKIEDDEQQTYNKGFFGRLIDKIKGIFKKKDKREVQMDEGKEAPTEDEIKPRGRTRQKSILDDLTKKDEKAKKKTIKEDKKAEKKRIKAEEKAKRQLEKDKAKEAKQKAKEQAKLEKEIKKLEEELKKEEEEKLNQKYKEEKKKKEAEEKKKKEEEKLEKEIKKLEEELKKEEEKEKKKEKDKKDD